MNPDTNTFEEVESVDDLLRRRDGSPVPENWPVFRTGETIILRKYRWRVGKMEGSDLTLTGVGPLGDVKPRSTTKRNRRKRQSKARRR